MSGKDCALLMLGSLIVIVVLTLSFASLPPVQPLDPIQIELDKRERMQRTSGLIVCSLPFEFRKSVYLRIGRFKPRSNFIPSEEYLFWSFVRKEVGCDI